MTFTKTPPTTPGFYAWRRDEQSPITLAVIVDNAETWRAGTIPVEHCHLNGGEWCRLVPAEKIQSLRASLIELLWFCEDEYEAASMSYRKALDDAKAAIKESDET